MKTNVKRLELFKYGLGAISNLKIIIIAAAPLVYIEIRLCLLIGTQGEFGIIIIILET